MIQINVLNYKWNEFVGVSFKDIVAFHSESSQMIKIIDTDKCAKLYMG